MLYNPSCIAEMEKFEKFCTDFQIEVINSVSIRFKISLLLMIAVMTFKLYVQYSKPKFSQTEFYKKYVAFRIDFIIAILMIITIGLMFI